MTKQSVQHVAYSIAKNALLLCETRIGIAAGRHHFVDLWARDSLFASFGATAAGIEPLSKQTIETFLSHQRTDGLIPYRIMRSKSTIGKYMGHPQFLQHPVASFRSRQSGGIVPDGGLMTIIAAGDWIKNAGKRSDATRWYPSLVRAARWYEHRFGHGRLITEWFQCEWADAVLKVGQTIYTNVLYYKALTVMGDVAKSLHKTTEAKKYHTMALSIKNEINQKFWNGTYFSDWVDWRRQDYFASYANMLAILWGVASRDQAQAILLFARTHTINSFTLETNTPVYPLWRIPLHHYVLGMEDYHNAGCLWLQPGILYALSLHIMGAKREAKEFFHGMSAKIAADGVVSEVYERTTGVPIKRRFYRSEQPFAWSAGLYLWAVHTLGV